MSAMNTEYEKISLKESLKNTEDLQTTLQCLEHVLVHRTPFALYIATADKSDCAWIFDPDTIYRMIGGQDRYTEVFNSLFPTDDEKAVGVVFFIFKKIGPLYSARVDIETIDEVINELYDEL